MSKKAKKIYGVDISKNAINFAKSNYKSKNIRFINKNIVNLNFRRKFDVIISLETLEHLKIKDALLWFKKCNKMLRKNGIFVCSSPLLRVRNNKPFITNPHHLHEMRKNEFFYNLKKIFNPKKINSYIQQNNNLIPLSNQKDGLSIISLTK
jgi:2-polyprenyl-3-methyl-5-hydroxy-6-metoxy-1,4-benzoquinol methylase